MENLSDILSFKQNEIDRVNLQLEKLKKEYSNIEALVSLYPDLTQTAYSRNSLVFCSKYANNKVTDFELKYSCSCCSDAYYEAWFYLPTAYGNVYSSPAYILVGRKSYLDDGSIDLYDNWEDKLIKNNIPQNIIDNLKHTLNI